MKNTQKHIIKKSKKINIKQTFKFIVKFKLFLVTLKTHFCY